jgi:PAS domain S-box-containing protein
LLESINSENHAEQIVREAEGFLQSALDALSAHVAILDETGTITGVNAAWRRYADENGFNDQSYGLGSNYLAVCDASAGINTPDAVKVGDGIRAVMNKQIPEFYLEYPCHSPTEKRWYVVRVTRFEWYNTAHVIVAHQSITELKHVQLELEENQKRLQSIFDTVVNGIVTLDEQGRVESVNPAAGKIFGYAPEDMIGRSFDVFLDTPCELDCLQTHTDYELTGKCSDGSTFPIYFAMNVTNFDGGHVYTVVVQDITERKRLEAELVEKKKLSIALEKERELREFKSRFMSMMSHELRTPLTSIRLSYDMLTTYAEQTPEEEKPQLLANIRGQVDYLTDLVKDVLTISKAESQQLDFAPERRDLLTFCRSVIEEFQMAYHKTRRITFDTNCARLEAMIDGKLMRQVLNNLLSNAVKYSPDSGKIACSLMCEGEEVVFRVADQGIGIPPEDLSTLFEPFHRASNVGKLPGTGLGLAITKQAVEIHDGSICVESALGTGTTVIVYLPVVHAVPFTEEDDDWA